MPLYAIEGVEVELEQSEIDVLIAEAQQNGLSNDARNRRNLLLTETDWWAVADRTMTQAEIDYRQALRDVPQQAGFPENITWPTKP